MTALFYPDFSLEKDENIADKTTQTLDTRGLTRFSVIIPWGHTFSTVMIQSGVDAKTLSNMLGHYSAAFTLDVYTHVTTQMQEAAAEKMSGFLAKISV